LLSVIADAYLLAEITVNDYLSHGLPLAKH
jgi:hypothetical protein